MCSLWWIAKTIYPTAQTNTDINRTITRHYQSAITANKPRTSTFNSARKQPVPQRVSPLSIFLNSLFIAFPYTNLSMPKIQLQLPKMESTNALLHIFGSRNILLQHFSPLCSKQMLTQLSPTFPGNIRLPTFNEVNAVPWKEVNRTRISSV